MPSRSYHIGLDFGTSQTKVCVQHLSARPQVHEFIQFRRPDGSASCFLPSQIAVRKDGSLAFGYECENADGNTYSYFKIASAEDVGFHVASFEAGDGRREKEQYDAKGYGTYTPELFSVLYLTYVLLYVKDQFRTRQQPQRRSGLLGRLTQHADPPEAQFTVQLGFPTEYLSKVNHLRKRKFETMLLLASRLESEVGSMSSFRHRRMEALRQRVYEMNQEIEKQASTAAEFDSLLSTHGLAVFPESAAGLTFLVKTGRLPSGYYAALDIGGGSTDVSFFRVNSNGRTSYLASESLLLASNDVYHRYGGLGSRSIASLRSSERDVRRLCQSGPDRVLADDRYVRAVRAVTSDIHRAMYRIFNERVYWLFNQGAAFVNKARGSYAGQPCFVYGGGAHLPIPDGMSRIVVHDNGRRNAPEELLTYIVREQLDQYGLDLDRFIRPDPETLRVHMPTLVVADGLSFPHHASEALWDMGDYRQARFVRVERQHPVNEGMYVYDVVEREWLGDRKPKTRPPNTPARTSASATTQPATESTSDSSGTGDRSSSHGTCPYCGKTKQWLLEHITVAHGAKALDRYRSDSPPAGETALRTDRYCELCDVVFWSCSEQKAHRSKQHPSIRCRFCGEFFRQKSREASRICPECWRKVEAKGRGRRRHRKGGHRKHRR